MAELISRFPTPVLVAVGVLLLLAGVLAMAATGRRRLAVGLVGSVGGAVAAGAAVLMLLEGFSNRHGGGDGGIGLLPLLWFGAIVVAPLTSIAAFGVLATWASRWAETAALAPRSQALATAAAACLGIALLAPPASMVVKAFDGRAESVERWRTPELLAYVEANRARRGGSERARFYRKKKMQRAIAELGSCGEPACIQALEELLGKELAMDLTADVAAAIAGAKGEARAVELLWARLRAHPRDGHDAIHALHGIKSPSILDGAQATLGDASLHLYHGNVRQMLLGLDPQVDDAGRDRVWTAFTTGLDTEDGKRSAISAIVNSSAAIDWMGRQAKLEESYRQRGMPLPESLRLGERQPDRFELVLALLVSWLHDEDRQVREQACFCLSTTFWTSEEDALRCKGGASPSFHLAAASYESQAAARQPGAP